MANANLTMTLPPLKITTPILSEIVTVRKYNDEGNLIEEIITETNYAPAKTEYPAPKEYLPQPSRPVGPAWNPTIYPFPNPPVITCNSAGKL